MKHSLTITLILLATFLSAQFIGLGIVYKYIDPVKSAAEGKTIFAEGPMERPDIEESKAGWYVIAAILIGTGLLLLIVKSDWQWLMKGWFLLAVIVTLLWAFRPFFGFWISVILAIIMGLWKIFRPNLIIQNLTELFIYGGLAAIFVPIFNLWSVSILLILIALYDAYAVWKSKHMITLAKSQMKQKIFAGLLIPYQLGKMAKRKVTKINAPPVKRRMRTAILG